MFNDSPGDLCGLVRVHKTHGVWEEYRGSHQA